jgi:hypothetical protein
VAVRRRRSDDEHEQGWGAEDCERERSDSVDPGRREDHGAVHAADHAPDVHGGDARGQEPGAHEAQEQEGVADGLHEEQAHDAVLDGQGEEAERPRQGRSDVPRPRGRWRRQHRVGEAGGHGRRGNPRFRNRKPLLLLGNSKRRCRSRMAGQSGAEQRRMQGMALRRSFLVENRSAWIGLESIYSDH